MKKKRLIMATCVALALLLALAGVGTAAEPALTAQSAMVKLTLDSEAYQIEGTITWTYDRDTAETYYNNAWDNNPPTVKTGQGTQPPTPDVPAPLANKLMQHAQAQRCVFFCGGELGNDTYTQTVTETRGWAWTYTYNITPKSQDAVGAHTCWSSEETGGSVDVGFNGFISSESYLSQSKKTKYSFTLTDATGSRVLNVAAQLQKLVQNSDGSESWVNVGAPINYITLPVTPTTADYLYYGNAGVFGKSSSVYNQLHAPGGKPETMVSGILGEDSFPNNDNDLAMGNVNQANYSGAFPGITEAGDYRILVTGTVKSNDATANFNFSVTSNMIVIGGCNCGH